MLTLTVVAAVGSLQGRSARAPRCYARMFEGIGALPGVEAVGAATVTPLTGNNWTVPFERADRPVPEGQRPPDVGWQSATGGYFRALQIPLRDGRLFVAQDGPAGAAGRDHQRGGAGAVLPGRKCGRAPGPARRRRAPRSSASSATSVAPRSPTARTPTCTFRRSTSRSSGDDAVHPHLRRSAAIGRPTSAPRCARSNRLIVLREIRTMDDVMRESVQVTRLALWLLAMFAATARACWRRSGSTA